MEAESRMSSQEKIEVSIEVDDVINYAMQQNGAKIVRDVCIINNTEEELQNLMLEIDADIDLIEPFKLGIEALQAGEELHFHNLKVVLKGNYLASLTERVSCMIQTRISMNEEVVCSEKKEIVVLAYDQWPGLRYTPELLATFSMPNHPVVANLIHTAAQYLEKWTKNPSLAGYQYEDPNRVKMMAAAAYAAIQQKNIIYAEAPSSFEEAGQRIRLADAVVEQYLGNCLDMTLLYSACLEAMGLNPILIMMCGHIFAGFWLVDDSFTSMIMDDPSQLEKRMANGIRELCVVECTAMCAGKDCSFDDAVKTAEREVSNYGNYLFAIDVRRARSLGIRPLPMRMRTDSGFEIKHEERKDYNVTNAPSEVGDTFDLNHLSEKGQVTKQTQWERKLLDLSMRNMLINMRITKAIVPLLAENVSVLEDVLSEGEAFQVLARPKDMAIRGEGIPIEALSDLGSFAEFIALEGKHRRLHSFYTEGELNSSLTKMYRSAKTSMEENGASTLYLAIGLLRWFEGSKVKTVRYAPIVLIPISIARTSANKGYSMRMRDEDAQINITLLEFLKQNFNLQIGGLNPPPTDEHGLDIPKIFALIRHAVMTMEMWDVVEAGFIGNFSFSQFVMWNDIHSRTDMLEKNKIVRSLMKGAVDWDCTVPENVGTDEAYLPITADSSQLRAINMAANDVSFVLHGPPGTGKSQTITAMIANALTKGKTVLFVAEKMAALEVVEKRLDALGIGDFCLELHSNKATKKTVLDQMRKTLEIGVWGIATEYDKKIEELHRMREEIDAYVKKLHERRAFGKTLRELIDIYELIPDCGKELRFNTEYAASLVQEKLDHQRRILEQLVAAAKEVGHPHGHPLLSVKQTEYTQSLKMNLDENVTAYKDKLAELKNDTEQFISLMELEMPISSTEWTQLLKCVNSILAVEKIPAFLRDTVAMDKEFFAPLSYLEKKEAFEKKKELFTSRWNSNFLRLDMSVFRTRYEEATNKLFGRNKAIANLTAELQAYASFQLKSEYIPVQLTDIMFYQKEEEEVNTLGNELSFEWKKVLEDVESHRALEEYREQIQQQLSTIELYRKQIRKLEEQGKFAACIESAAKMVEDTKDVFEKEKNLSDLLKISFEDMKENWLNGRMELCTGLLQNVSGIKDWIVYQQLSEECRSEGLAEVCDAYEAGMEHDLILDLYQKSIYKAIILSVIEKEPVLNGFTGAGFNEQIAQFKKMDQEFMDLTKEEMYYKLTHQLPTGYESVQMSMELNILRRAISSNGRGVSIRTLFEQIPHVLAKLCPCMLMSPISVAQYLSTDNEPFDIVIFDEASQLPTCKAVGVLARGKNAVIVGDPNQMPPTSFFAGNTVDEDNLDIEDLDSILDDCLALGMPQTHLKWHYRSHHESLIAFSNQEFYENSMLTFPSVNDRERRVKLIRTEGFFDRGKGRVNEGEAKAIVKELKRRYANPEYRNETIGVVTFNISQQTLIEDMLQLEYQKDIEFDKWANTGEEPLFIKNLENVQGDERDVILFSVAFGPDADGKLSLNFGPLNRDGGWKRLNVAVSRARDEMVVFSTMTADMIELKRTKSKGVESLKNFLEYAEKGDIQRRFTQVQQKKDQGILNRICKEIENAGYQYQKSVGHSKFKVDIAVINPYNADEYLLGILLDGDSYKQSVNTKDREVAQISMLERLGWNLYRMWTLDWWDNREKEIRRLLTMLAEQKKEAAERAVEEKIEQQSEAVSEGEAALESEIEQESEAVPRCIQSIQK